MTSSDSKKEVVLTEGFINEYTPSLKRLDYTIKDLKDIVGPLSNKIIHDWQRQGLTFGVRKNKHSGWLRFSLNDVVGLKIIVECRAQDIPLPIIKDALEKISRAHVLTNVASVHTQALRQVDLPLMDFAVLASMKGYKMFLIVDNDKAVVAEKESVNQSFNIKEVKQPMTILILPLFTYVKRAVSVMIQNDPKLQALKRAGATPKI